MRYVSGIRPTGHIHLGNYLGAIRQWRSLQDDGSVFFVADLHGIHTDDETLATVDALHRCGIRKVHIQSQFGHTRLYCDLLHYATMGQLSRMTQYKDKAVKQSETAALLTYPVLMAADIFHNRGTHVPVGNDQLQHIELARDLWDRLPEKPFPKPQAVVSEYPRIMSLTDGSKKMSKSDQDDMSRINLSDTPDMIRMKIAKAKTSMSVTDETPEAVNLRTIYRALGGSETFSKWKPLKEALAELIIAELS